jgi:hypothetical protein
VFGFEPAMMSAMQSIVGQWLYSLKHYVLMCLLLSSPARLPYSPYPVMLTGFAYFVIGLMLVDAQRGYVLVCTQIVLEQTMLGLISYFALRWKNSLARLPQTFSALLGINLVITAVTIPAYRLVASNGSVDSNLLVYVTLLILVWNLAVISLIFKRSFEISTQLSAMISFGYFIVYQIIVFGLYP